MKESKYTCKATYPNSSLLNVAKPHPPCFKSKLMFNMSIILPSLISNTNLSSISVFPPRNCGSVSKSINAETSLEDLRESLR